MVTGTAGDAARLFPWQMTHYIVRGGVNDPVLPATGGPPVTTGGICGFASTITLPPVPGQSAPRTMNVNSTAATTSGTTITSMVSPNAGILLGTIPQGAWITGVQIRILTAFAGGTNDTIGLYYQPANQAYGGATVNVLVSTTTLTAGLQGSPNPGTPATLLTTAPGLGPGTGAAGTLAATDIDVYFLTWLAAGGGTAFTAGQAAVLIEFTGLEG